MSPSDDRPKTEYLSNGTSTQPVCVCCYDSLLCRQASNRNLCVSVTSTTVSFLAEPQDKLSLA